MALWAAIAAALLHVSHAQTAPFHVSGVLPSIVGTAASAPKRSECGVGAMMAWADALWYVTYLSVPQAGNGTGLYRVDGNMTQTVIAQHSSVFANRLLVPGMQSIVIGPYVIDAAGGVRTITDLLDVRIGGMAEHLQYPLTKVYMLGMDGPLWEVDLVTLKATQLFDMVKALGMCEYPVQCPEQPHFKAAHSMAGKLWVATNTYEQEDALSIQHGGRLASWDGSSANWTIVERTAFVEVTGRHNMGQVLFAMGWDDASVILKVQELGGDETAYGGMTTYRLPKASHAYDHLWLTEWPRIREVETERYLLDMHGQFYELPAIAYGGAMWGIRPIGQHLRMVPDFASYRGMLVLGGNQVSSIFDNNWVTGQSQSGLWFGKTDDLFSLGKPQGWGGPWRYDAVRAGEPSDSFLMTGFDNKVAHIRIDAPAAALPRRGRSRAVAARGDTAAYSAPWPAVVTVRIQADFTGSAGHLGAKEYQEPWNTVASVTINASATDAASNYAFYAFPSGFSAHWIRFVADTDCNVTVRFGVAKMPRVLLSPAFASHSLLLFPTFSRPT